MGPFIFYIFILYIYTLPKTYLKFLLNLLYNIMRRAALVMRKKETALLTEKKLNELFIIENLTVKEIAEKYNLSTATVNRLLKQHNIKKSEEQRRAAISKTKQNKTEEERLEYSKKLSKARKGKGLGIEPWNKGTKGLQEAWNKGISLSDEIKQKIAQTWQNKTLEEKAAIEAKRKASRVYGEPANKGKQMSEEQKIKIRETLINKTPEEKREILNKQYETKKQHNTFVTSEPEEIFYEKLLSLFKKEDISRQYKEERYPFRCDFYIKPLDLFIELNYDWTHGFKRFEGTEQDLLKLAAWTKRAEESDFYKAAIETWTQRDILKFNIAKENNLNYLEYYSETEAIDNIENDLNRFR